MHWMPRRALAWTTPLALVAALSACNGAASDGTEGATTGGETSEASTASTTSDSASTSDGSGSATQATTSSGASDSATTSTSTQGTDTEATGVSVSGTESSTEPTTDATDPSSTTDPTDGTTTLTTTDSTTDSTDGTTTTDSTTDSTDGTTTDDTTTGCVPAVEVCNDVDDDCNGLIDDVDEAMDGICDCLNIVILGKAGANPSSEFANWLKAQGTQVDRIHTTPNEVLDAATLKPYDIVLLDWLQRTYTAEEAAVLEAFIAGGGGMISLTGYQANQPNANVTNSLITAIGLTYNTTKGWFNGPITTFANHPITMGLTSITFLGGLYVNLTDDGVGVNQAIMSLPQGPVGVTQERKGGRAFVFGDEWVEFDSQWQNLPEIKLFWVQTLKWVGPRTRARCRSDRRRRGARARARENARRGDGSFARRDPDQTPVHLS
ncbi:MAG: hypothetical protein R3B09_12210 [Nannocystaceae bacterium]